MRHQLLPLLPLILFAIAAAAAEPSGKATADPVVVELFTSQGCSSCPPADDLLGELGRRPEVIALSLHVDYWNRLGWTDPFSSPAYTARQQQYVRQLAARSPYTPMLVVGGEAHCVGSQVEEVEALLAKARARSRAGRVLISPRLSGGKLALDFEVELADETQKKLDLMVAIAEKSLATPVAKGENANRRLSNHHVVRRLEKVASVPKTAGTSRHRIELKLDKDWNSENLEAVAFLQDPKTLKIEGAARASLAPGSALSP
jgi:hypothetical protein